MGETVPTEIYYRFACSTLLVTGTLERKPDWTTGQATRKSTSDVSLFLQADPRRDARIRLPRHAGHGSLDLSVKLASDGRLLTISGSVKGILAEAVGAAAAAIGFAGGIAASVFAPGLKSGAAPLEAKAEDSVDESAEKTPAQRWAAENPRDAARLQAAVEALEDLHDAVVRIASGMGASDKPAPTYRKLIGIRGAISDVESEIKAINTRRDAWFDKNYSSSEEFRFELPTDSVYTLQQSHVLPPREIQRSDLDGGSVAARRILERLGLAIVEVTAEAEADRATTSDAADLQELMQDVERGERPLGVFYRVPRPAVIALYKQRETDKEKLELERATRFWLVDVQSRLGSVPLEIDHGLLGKATTTSAITFSEAGVPETIATSELDQLGATLDALGKAPERLSAGLTQAKNVADTWSALRGSRVEREIKALENRKKELETEIATRGLESDASRQETLQELKDRLERLKTERDIGDLTKRPALLTDEERHEEEQKHLLEQLNLQVEVARAQAELAAYREDATR